MKNEKFKKIIYIIRQGNQSPCGTVLSNTVEQLNTFWRVTLIFDEYDNLINFYSNVKYQNLAEKDCEKLLNKNTYYNKDVITYDNFCDKYCNNY